MGYNYKNIDKKRQEAPFLILERNIYENLNVGVLAKVVDTYEGGVKLKSLPGETYFDASYSLSEYIYDTTKETYSKGDLVVVMFLDNYGVKELTDTSKYIMHDYKNAVILGKVETIKNLNETTTNSLEDLKQKVKNIPDELSDVKDSFVVTNRDDYTSVGNNISVRQFTQTEIDALKKSTLTKIKIENLYFDDVQSSEDKENFIILNFKAQQKGVFGPEGSVSSTYDLYYQGTAQVYGIVLSVFLILNCLSGSGSLIITTQLTGLNVNDGNPGFNYYVPTSYGSEGQVLVSTGNSSNPFTYKNFHTRITGPVSFNGEGLSNAEIGTLIIEHPTVKLYYEKTSGSVKTVYNLNYKCEYDESTKTYTVEIYYFDGGSLVQLIPPSNRTYTLYYEYFE